MNQLGLAHPEMEWKLFNGFHIKQFWVRGFASQAHLRKRTSWMVGVLPPSPPGRRKYKLYVMLTLGVLLCVRLKNSFFLCYTASSHRGSCKLYLTWQFFGYGVTTNNATPPLFPLSCGQPLGSLLTRNEVIQDFNC